MALAKTGKMLFYLPWKQSFLLSFFYEPNSPRSQTKLTFNFIFSLEKYEDVKIVKLLVMF